MKFRKVEISEPEIERLQNVQASVSGLAHLINKMGMQDEQPEWWSDYHNGILAGALVECSANVDEMIDRLAARVGGDPGGEA